MQIDYLKQKNSTERPPPKLEHYSNLTTTMPEDTFTVCNPLDGKTVIEAKKIRQHPQFSDKFVVESSLDGFQFTYPLPSLEELAKVYSEDYNEMFGRNPSEIPNFVARRAAAQTNFISHHLGGPQKIQQLISHVGEAGAGWGELARHMTKALRPDAKVVAYELDQDSVKSMNESGIDARYGMLEEDVNVTELYDLVMTSHATEHFREPRAVFEKIRPLMKTGGYLFIEIPLENPVPNWWGSNPDKPYWVGHLYFFAQGHLEKMLESLKFKIVAKSCHDHPVSPGFVMPGSEETKYDMDKVPLQEDVAESSLGCPKTLRLLAMKMED